MSHKDVKYETIMSNVKKYINQSKWGNTNKDFNVNQVKNTNVYLLSNSTENNSGRLRYFLKIYEEAATRDVL